MIDGFQFIWSSTIILTIALLVVSVVLSRFSKNSSYNFFIWCELFMLTKLLLANPKLNKWVVDKINFDVSYLDAYYSYVDAVYVIFFILFTIYFLELHKTKYKTRLITIQRILQVTLITSTIITLLLILLEYFEYIVPFQIYIVLVIVGIMAILVYTIALLEISLFKSVFLLGTLFTIAGLVYTLVIIMKNPAKYISGIMLPTYYISIIILDVFVAIAGAMKYRDTIILLQQEQLAVNQNLFNKKVDELKFFIETERNERKSLANKLETSIGRRIRATIKLLSKGDDIKEEVRDILTTLKSAEKEVEKQVDNLYPELLLKEGFVTALEYYLQQIETIKFNVVDKAPMLKLNDEANYALFRIIQEIVENIEKQTTAKTGEVILNVIGYDLYVTIKEQQQQSATVIDFTTESIKNIQTRLNVIKGRLEFRTSKKGTKVEIFLPKSIFQNL